MRARRGKWSAAGRASAGGSVVGRGAVGISCIGEKRRES
jgi:hypothetical protein